LAALLHALRFVGLCRSAGACSEATLDGARELLRAAFEGNFDASPLLPELRRLAVHVGGLRGKNLRRRLAAVDSKGAASAALAAETLEAAAASAPPKCIGRIVACSGLPAGEEEQQVDQRAAKARAKGELFFEDVAGADVEDGADEEDGTVMTVAATVARKRALESLEGVEALRDTSGGTRAKKAKAKGVEEAEEEVAEAPARDAQRLRRRKKGS